MKVCDNICNVWVIGSLSASEIISDFSVTPCAGGRGLISALLKEKKKTIWIVLVRGDRMSPFERGKLQLWK